MDSFTPHVCSEEGSKLVSANQKMKCTNLVGEHVRRYKAGHVSLNEVLDGTKNALVEPHAKRVLINPAIDGLKQSRPWREVARTPRIMYQAAVWWSI